MATIHGRFGSEDERLLAAAAAELPPDWRVTLLGALGAERVEVVIHTADRRRVASAFLGTPDAHQVARYLASVARDHKDPLAE